MERGRAAPEASASASRCHTYLTTTPATFDPLTDFRSDMPVIDLRTGGDVLPHPTCDVCVVGTGPAGATLAQELSGTGLRVTVLESGGVERDLDTDRLNEIENA